MSCCIKSGQQRLAAGRKNFIFFLCPLDGEQFIPILPVLRVITWEDGKRYEIDWVIDIRQAPAMKAGGQEISIRYKYTGKDGIYSLSAAQIRPEAIWDDGLQRRISSLHN